MKKQDYMATLVVNASAKEAFQNIKHISSWWTENLNGRSENLNDICTVHFGETFVTLEIVELIPDQMLRLRVADCYLHWLTDKTEWKGTQLVFELSAEGDATRIQFTHVGLEPQVECFDVCVKGWDQYIKDSLYRLITEGKGLQVKRVKAQAELAN